MFDRILPCTKQLSDQLQSSTVDLSRASDLVSATTNMLHHFRTDDYWTQVYTYATDIAKLHSIPVESDDPNPRKRRRPAHLDDSVITESVGFWEPTTTSCHFKTKVLHLINQVFLVVSFQLSVMSQYTAHILQQFFSCSVK